MPREKKDDKPNVEQGAPFKKGERRTPNKNNRYKPSEEDKEFAKNTVADLLKGKTEGGKICAVMFGAHGSGKDYLRSKIAEKMGLKKNNYVLICREKLPELLKEHKEWSKECADNYSGNHDKDKERSCVKDQIMLGMKAWKMMSERLFDECASKKLDVVINSTGRDINMLNNLKNKFAGYTFKLFFPYAPNDKIHERVLKLAKKNGYYNEDSYTDRVIGDSVETLKNSYEMFDEFYIYDNSEDDGTPSLVASKDSSGKIKCDMKKKSYEPFTDFLKNLCSKAGSGEDDDRYGRGNGGNNRYGRGDGDDDHLGGDSSYDLMIGGNDCKEGGGWKEGGVCNCNGPCNCAEGGHECGCVGECDCKETCEKCGQKNGGDGCGCSGAKGGRNYDNVINGNPRPSYKGGHTVFGGCDCCGGSKKVIVALAVIIILLIIGLLYFEASPLFNNIMAVALAVVVVCQISCLLKT